MTAAAPERSASSSGDAVRVTLVSTLPPHKGLADYTSHLVNGLATTPGVLIEVIDFASLYPKRLYPGGELEDATATRPNFRGVRVRTMLRWWNPISWLWAGLTLRGNVVHAQWWSYVLAPPYFVILAVSRLRRRRVVITVHNVEPHEAGRWQRTLNRIVLGLAHAYIVHDERSRDRLAEIVSARKQIAVIPHGILSSGETPQRDDARRALGIAADSKVVLYFGNIRPYKGVDVLLRAFAIARQQIPEARLRIAGNLWGDWDPYDTLIKQLGLEESVDVSLDFVPAKDVGPLFAACDVVVLPYLQFDAQSGVGARAIYHKRALIVSDVGGLPELVADDRAVVPPGDHDRLAEALAKALTDPAFARKLEADSALRAAELSWDTIAAETVRIYDALRTESSAALPHDERVLPNEGRAR
jgi:glycosyltransferase involved in cell wall biosynthesis